MTAASYPAVDNLVHELSTSTGTGNFTTSSVNGKQSFNGAFGNGATTDVFYYFISNRDVASEREYGSGHMSAANTLVRDTVIGGSNSTSLVNFSAGTKDIWCDIPASFQSSAARTVKVQTFTGTGTYTPAIGMLYCIIECIGGGGGGGGAAGTVSNAFAGAGGGSGGYSRLVASAATIGASKAVTIGAAGAGGSAGANNGTAGGDTSVTTICVAKGGAGGGYGSVASASAGAAGGIAGTGDIASPGVPGGNGFYSVTASVVNPSGCGGSSHFGGGAVGVAASGNGVAAGGNGSGGSGAFANSTASTYAGGNGSAGLVIITEFCIR